MVEDPLKFRRVALWIAATVAICALEAYLATYRTLPATVPRSFAPLGIPSEPASRIIVGDIHGPTILVLGNPGSARDSEIEVILTAEPVPAQMTSARQHRFPAKPKESAFVSSGREPLQPTPPNSDELVQIDESAVLMAPAPAKSIPPDRIYFLPKSLDQDGLETGSLAIPVKWTGQNSRVAVYLDRRLLKSSAHADLVEAVLDASVSELGDTIQQLVGPVRDIDQDGHFSIVLTPETERFGRGTTPVHGLTRPADFIPGVDRPVGNTSDVIFLSSNLTPGDHLRAILAHEWCHAAMFSRSEGPSDDWLNESLAHVVEVQASRSVTNLSHRIDRFLNCPEQAPLVIGNYAHPDYWRHDGCRGAAFLFLTWCREHSDGRFLDRLVRGPLDLSGLEAAAGKSMEELFRGWTTDLGRSAAIDSGRQVSFGTPISRSHVMEGRSPHYDTWRLDADSSRSYKLQIRASCAKFIRIESDLPNGAWRVTALSSALRPTPGGQQRAVETRQRLQATLIPCDSANPRGDSTK